jgi:hypothetical protein
MSWKKLLLLAALSYALPAFAQSPKSCLDIHLGNPFAPDGDYTIEPRPGMVFTVYCHNMAAWAPAEYLTLVNTGGDSNFGQYTAGGASPGTDVRTSFTRIRLDPATLLVDIGDLTFATSTGQVMHANGGPVAAAPYGVALDCAGGGSQTGIANIDLTGTPFAVKGSFFAHGWYPGGSVAADGAPAIPIVAGYPSNGATDAVVEGKVVTVRGGGYCGSAGPRGINSAHGRWLGPSAGMFALQLEYAP